MVEDEERESQREQEGRPQVVGVEEDRPCEERGRREDGDRRECLRERRPKRPQDDDRAREHADSAQSHGRLECERVVRAARDPPEQEDRLREGRVLVEEVAVRHLPCRHLARVARVDVEVGVERRVTEAVPDEQAGEHESGSAEDAERERLRARHHGPTAPL